MWKKLKSSNPVCTRTIRNFVCEQRRLYDLWAIEAPRLEIFLKSLLLHCTSTGIQEINAIILYLTETIAEMIEADLTLFS